MPTRRALWAGRILSGLALLFLAFDPESVIVPLGLIQLVCLVAYLVPRTTVLGAVLWTGYLGGAVATHVRVGSPLLTHTLFPIYVAIFLWLGLWLRDARLRAVLPLRAAD